MLALVVLVLVALSIPSGRNSLARFSDMDASGGSLGADTLAPHWSTCPNRSRVKRTPGPIGGGESPRASPASSSSRAKPFIMNSRRTEVAQIRNCVALRLLTR